MKIRNYLLLILLVTSASANAFALTKADFVGSWKFYAEGAPYEYNSGDIVIGKDGKDYTAKIVYSESYEITGRDVVVEKDVISFYVWIEDQKISIKGTVEGDTIAGKATYSEGTITFKADRKEE
jgi:hypothetical protein